MRQVQKAIFRCQNDGGAALVTVLLLVAVMSIAAVTSFEAIGFAVKRTAAARLYDQARLYALGGEQIASIAAERLATTDQALLRAVGFDGGSDISYPITGGSIFGAIEDASNCFNVNSLVETLDAGVLVANAATLLQYQHLLELSGFSEGEAEQLSATLVDWLDSDSRQSPRGAEDYDYAAFAPPYRAANTLMADISELALVSGYTPEVRTIITPFLCVLPESTPAKLNVNSLLSSDALLLTALVGRAFTFQQMRSLIAERAARGYETEGDFWGAAVFNGRNINQTVRASVAVKPTRFRASIHVRYYDADVYLTSHIWTGNGGKARIINRSFGVFP